MTGTRSSQVDIALCTDVGHFFRRVVDDVRASRRLDTTETATTYVAALLADFSDPRHYEGSSLERPLTLLLHDALRERSPESFERLRRLGDVVLYLSGFFGEHFERRGVTQEYVTQLGAQAYWGARQALSWFRITPEEPGDTTDLFHELAANFESFRMLVEGVAWGLPGRKGGHQSSLLDLYERWLRTGSELLAEQLGAAGILPRRGDGAVH